MENRFVLPQLNISVNREDISFYTTLLQSGIEIKTCCGESMGSFLTRLPGFTVDYITDTVQTIFLNGTATDDLSTPFSGENPVLAVSAAMPGLAGAIFRRNSLHAALRTTTATTPQPNTSKKPLMVTFKLFNTIALERGAELLAKGVCIKASHFINFIVKRATLLDKANEICLSDTIVKAHNLPSLLTDIRRIKLKIVHNYG